MKIMTISELKQKLYTEEVLLIDVRETSEYQTGIIQGALLIPLRELIQSPYLSTQKQIVFYCRSGKRSAYACEKINESHPSLNTASLEGGILAWNQAGYPIQIPPR